LGRKKYEVKLIQIFMVWTLRQWRMDLMTNISKVGINSLFKLSDKGLCLWQVKQMSDTCLLWPINMVARIFFILLSETFLFLAFQNCFIALNVEKLQYYIKNYDIAVLWIDSFFWYLTNRIPY
jgi:uncharacterized membrane protein